MPFSLEDHYVVNFDEMRHSWQPYDSCLFPFASQFAAKFLLGHYLKYFA